MLTVGSPFWAFPVSVLTAARRSGTPRPFPSDRDGQSGRDGPLLERDVGNGGTEGPVRLVQGPLGPLLADHPARANRSLAAGADEAKRAFEAMMPMKKLDVAAIEAARRG